VDKDGLRPLPEKVEALHIFPKPTTLRKLREDLGLANFYKRFLPDSAKLLLLTNLLSGKFNTNAPITWSPAAESAFEQSKASLAQATMLHHPHYNAPTCIAADASDHAVGAVLQQMIDGVWSPIAYISKKLQPAETRYSTFDRELLAVYLAIIHFRHFVEGREFHMLTDHRSLTFSLQANNDRSPPDMQDISTLRPSSLPTSVTSVDQTTPQQMHSPGWIPFNQLIQSYSRWSEIRTSPASLP